MLDLNKKLVIIKNMTLYELRQKYSKVFGEKTNARNKTFLIKRIAWRLQANSEGGLSNRAKQRAKEIVDEADLRDVLHG